MVFSLALLISVNNPIEASVRVNPGRPSSGTVVRVEKHKHKYVSYILSTGHFQNAVGEAAFVEFFYHEGQKLDTPIRVKGKVVYKIDKHEKGEDFSVIKVKTDFRPAFVLIAKNPPKLPFFANSIGCDLGVKPKSHLVMAHKSDDMGVMTKFNNPLPGRSGGGLIVNGELVAVCWGGRFTCESTGWAINSDRGFFTSHEVITKHLSKSKFAFLLQ